MLKRCSPRSSTSAVSANGRASTTVAPLFPLKNAASPWSVPGATVPSTSGGALEPFLKNMLSRSGIAFGWLCMSCRQPAAARKPSAMRANGQRRTANAVLRLNFVHLAGVEPLQEIARLQAVGILIGRLDQEGEFVPAPPLAY